MASNRFGAPKFQPIVQAEDQEALAPLLTQETRGAEAKPPILYPLRPLHSIQQNTLDDEYLENCKFVMDKFGCSGFQHSIRRNYTKSSSEKMNLMMGKRDLYDELSSESVDATFPKELSRFFSKRQRTSSTVSSSSLSAVSFVSLSALRADQTLTNIIQSINSTASTLKQHDDEYLRTDDIDNKKSKDTKDTKDVKQTDETAGTTKDDDDDDENDDDDDDQFAYDDDDDDSGDDYSASHDVDGDDDDFDGGDDDEGCI